MKNRYTTKCKRGIGAAFILMTLLIIHGCAVVPPQSSTEPGTLPSEQSLPEPGLPQPGLPQQEPPLTVQRTGPATSTKAVVALMARAGTAQQAGQLELAAANLERAVRISPKDPRPWQALAEIRLQQGNSQQAEAMAAKSNSRAAGAHKLLRRNWQIIAEARRLAGDQAGALRADKKARTFD